MTTKFNVYRQVQRLDVPCIVRGKDFISGGGTVVTAYTLCAAVHMPRVCVSVENFGRHYPLCLVPLSLVNVSLVLMYIHEEYNDGCLKISPCTVYWYMGKWS